MTSTQIRSFPDIGLTENAQKGIVEVLSQVLGDEHILYIKLRKYHWNVTGPQFHELHKTFEEQYTTLAEVIDEIAERIVQYGALSPGTMQEFLDLARLEEQPGEVPEAHDMLANTVADHETMIRNLRDDIEVVGEKHGDVGAEDFLIGLLQTHQEQAWMLRAMMQGQPIAG